MLGWSSIPFPGTRNPLWGNDFLLPSRPVRPDSDGGAAPIDLDGVSP